MGLTVSKTKLLYMVFKTAYASIKFHYFIVSSSLKFHYIILTNLTNSQFSFILRSIQSINLETRVYTPGFMALAQPRPHDVTP